jgi:hypothetical protein
MHDVTNLSHYLRFITPAFDNSSPRFFDFLSTWLPLRLARSAHCFIVFPQQQPVLAWKAELLNRKVCDVFIARQSSDPEDAVTNQRSWVVIVPVQNPVWFRLYRVPGNRCADACQNRFEDPEKDADAEVAVVELAATSLQGWAGPDRVNVMPVSLYASAI